ncbi:unnamed protein product [Cylicocyclus nassatus]|uniref:Uncharacterized protein n=1 Tax=Cylicocyclus nassatus TaxID=53992 RepID=A0AA36GDF1_CYLNA|nr:unnamed protein product [Cylicocyclus nassatus]
MQSLTRLLALLLLAMLGVLAQQQYEEPYPYLPLGYDYPKRYDPDIFDGGLTFKGLRGLRGKRMPYMNLKGLRGKRTL